MTAGSHVIQVSCGQPHDFIRAAGTSVPVVDPFAPDSTVQHGVSADVSDEMSSPGESRPIK